MLAAPASGKGPDNPFDERASGSESAGDENEEQAKKPPGETTKPSDEPATSEQEEGGEEPSTGEEEETEGSLHALACLEGETADGKRKGVQRRDFLKKHRFELAAVGGYYASDALSSTYSYGGALAYYPSEDFGLELLVTYTPIKFRLEEPFNAFDQEQHFQSSSALQGIGSLLWVIKWGTMFRLKADI